MWRTTGHDKAVGLLRRSLQEGRVPHACLFTGPPQVGKGTLALDLARALNCLGAERPCGECGQCSRIERGLHADVKTVGLLSGEGGGRALIGIDQVREVQREASLKPYEGASRVFIFDGAERLSEDAANSLLKTLEEPPAQVVLVLLASDREALLTTIVSRCRLFELRPVPAPVISGMLQERHGAGPETAEEVARLSDGRPGWAVDALTGQDAMEELAGALASIESLVGAGLEERFAYAAGLAASMSRDREAGRRSLALWLAWWRDVMLVREGAPGLATHGSAREAIDVVAGSLSSAQVAGAVRDVRQAMDHLDRNVNPRLALEHLMLALPRPSQPA